MKPEILQHGPSKLRKLQIRFQRTNLLNRNNGKMNSSVFYDLGVRSVVLASEITKIISRL